ncbi:MAG: class I SAM-dependent methyltransferase [Thermodesulfobacteriota bacterium]
MLDKVTEKISKAFEVEKVPFRRNLSTEEMRKLQDACNRAFNSVIHIDIIEKIMDYCCYVERNMKGRAAGNIEDMIIRYLIRFYASMQIEAADNACHLEIGALFGAATIFSCHAIRLSGKKNITVVIDPLEGYYGREKDLITNLPVDENTFWSNIERFGYSKDMIEVKKGYSDDENILKLVKNYQILSLLIDGDHSYEGVKKDWLNYSPLVVTGGYVLIDDYNSYFWPDVSNFVNKEIISNLAGKWEVVLVFGNSIILKRTELEEFEMLSTNDVLFHQLKGMERKVQLGEDALRQRDELLRLNSEEIKSLKNEIKRLRNTWSWKLTSPLRYFYNLLKNN